MLFRKQGSSRKRRLVQAAYTLTEVVVSTAILGTCAGSFMAGFGSGFFTIELTRENQRATQILIEKTETIRLYSWDQINTPGFIPTEFTEQYDHRNNGGITYTGRVAIADSPLDGASYKSDVRQLTVTLAWSTKGVPRERSITTFIAKDGLQNYVY